MRSLLAALIFACPMLQAANLLPDAALSVLAASPNIKLGNAKLLNENGKELLRLEASAPDLVNSWDLQASLKNALSVKAGDRILASFRMRAMKTRAESGEAESEFVFELAKDPNTKSMAYPLHAGLEWRQFQIAFESVADYAPGEAQMIFRMGYAPEIFDISDFSVINYGKTVKLSELPKTQINYAGHEPGAPWRKAALERIQKLRMAQIKVSVVDGNGQPLKGARISVNQKRNAFHFGAATSGHYVFKDSDAAGRAKYESVAKANFNMATEENGLKWAPLSGDWGKDWNMDSAKKYAAWVKSLGLDFRAHCLIWPSWRNMPKSAQALKKDKKALHQLVFDHIKAEATAMKGIPVQWDVMNEPFDNHDLMDIFGDSVMVDFFNTAHKADPNAELFINDYAILAGGAADTPHRRHYEKTIQYLIDKGAPFDGIGMQGHFGWTLTAPEDALKILARYARFHKKIMVTEYDIDVNDLDLAGDYFRDLLILLYSHPSVSGFIMWGFWDGAHWHQNAPLFNKDWSPKPAYKAWEDLVLNEWHTDASGVSADGGVYSTRGHLGDYEIKVTSGGKTVTRAAKLGHDGLELKITLN